MLTDRGTEVDPSKVEVLRNWKIPTTVTGVKSFLGFAGYYRHFVKDFSRIAKPISNLQSPQNPFVWTPECAAAFEEIKRALLAIPTLAHFDPELPVILETDASDGVIAGVLSQTHSDGKNYPVAFYSHVLTGSELNWEIHDKELFAIVYAFTKWRAELASTRIPIQVYSDHRALEYFMTTKVLNARQVRWAEYLAPFDFRIQYTPGKSNARADILSRREQDMANLKEAQTDNRNRVFLGPHRLDPRINSELARQYIQDNRAQAEIFSVNAPEQLLALDSFGLISELINANKTGFPQERASLPPKY
jgi:hypothetical protein